MKITRRQLTQAAALIVATHDLSACGGRDGGAGPLAQVPTPTSNPSPSPEPNPSPTPNPVPLFPLRIHESNRYFVDASGNPFFIHGDACWSLVSNLDRSDIDYYLDDRRSKGFNAILVLAPDHYFTSQTPRYRNKQGFDPFIGMVDGASPGDVVMMNWAAPNSSYWSLMDYAVAACKSRGMLMMLDPCYQGIPHNPHEGWGRELVAASDASLTAYGQFLGNRYGGYGNIIWVHGGDVNSDATATAKMEKIIDGVNSVAAGQLHTGHATTNSNTRDVWAGRYWFNGPNCIYQWYAYGGDPGGGALAGYNDANPHPQLLYEGEYDGLVGNSYEHRLQAWQTLCSGACGHFFGNEPVWHFNCIGRESIDWKSRLNTQSTQQIAHVRRFFTTLAWWKLAPATGSSLVTNALGAGIDRICPARASDGTFAIVLVPNPVTLNVAMSAMTPKSVRARWYDPSNGAFTAIGGSPFANLGTSSIAYPGANAAGDSDWVLVLD